MKLKIIPMFIFSIFLSVSLYSLNATTTDTTSYTYNDQEVEVPSFVEDENIDVSNSKSA